MPTRTIGSEFKRFFNDKSVWREGAYMQDEEIIVDGDLIDADYDIGNFQDDARVAIIAGVFIDENEDSHPLESVFVKWRKRQNISSFIVEAPNGVVGKVRAACRSAGGKILR